METLATQIADHARNILLIYAFNGTGKTRLSVAHKDITKARNADLHAGVYYNAYSEDLFSWDNDNENGGADVRLHIQASSLNQYHPSLEEENLREKLAPYKPTFGFRFQLYSNPEEGIESVRFFLKQGIETSSEEPEMPIKISRGEEQIFIWCFFLALFDLDGLTGEGRQSSHFFIDDPVSSLDDHNIFVTASSVLDLIERHHKTRKIIITTHHVYFFSIICDWLSKGEKASSYKNNFQHYILKNKEGSIQFLSSNQDVFLYHLELLQTLKKAVDDNKLYAYHFALLRQVLENISSFHGYGNFSFVLKHIGFSDDEEIASVVTTMSHRTVFRYEARELVPDNERRFKEIFERIQQMYQFKLHA